MVDIVIVNWNSGGYLLKCIESIFQNNNSDFLGTVFIIDNNSSDNSISVLPSYSKVLLINNKDNLGFSKACNQGFLLSKEKYTLLLNPDAQLLDATLRECISFMEKNTNVDILGVSLLDDKGKVTPSCARFPAPLRYLYDALGLSKIAPRIFHPALLMKDWNHNESKKVDQVMGAFMFMRNAIFEKLGYFDERFFVYYEELDFSKRLAEAGGISYYNSEIKAIHTGEGTTSNVKTFRLFLNLRSRLQYSRKHFNFTGYSIVWLCTFIIEPFTRNILLLVQGKFKDIRNVLKAYVLLIKKKRIENHS
jgi:GT2 family glycosyltransferase